MSEVNSTVSYRDILGFPGYRVGDDGSVWSCRTFAGTIGSTWHRLTPRIDKDGYLVVTPCRNSKSFLKRVHHLVLEAFVGPRPTGKIARHFPDRNPANNAISNLQWATHKENQADRVIHGTHSRGEKNSWAKLSEDAVRSIRAEYAAGKISQRKLAKKYNVTQYAIFSIVNRQTWRHIA